MVYYNNIGNGPKHDLDIIDTHTHTYMPIYATHMRCVG